MALVRKTQQLFFPQRSSARRALIISGLLVPHLFGCADDGATIIDETGVAQPTTNESDSGESGSGPGAEGPYVGTLEVATPDGEQDYTARVPAMAALTDDAFRRGIERGAVAFGHDGAVFVRGADSPTLTKFGVDGAGAFVEGATLSFAGLGATQMGRVAVVTEGKAYGLDQQNRLLAWVPSTMELTGGVVNLEEALAQLAPNWSPTIGILRASGEGRLFVPVSLRRVGEYGDEFRLSATLVVVDTTTDEVVSIAEDDRICDSIYTTVSDSGDLYVYTGGLGVIRHGALGDACPGGVVRVRSGVGDSAPSRAIPLGWRRHWLKFIQPDARSAPVRRWLAGALAVGSPQAAHPRRGSRTWTLPWLSRIFKPIRVTLAASISAWRPELAWASGLRENRLACYAVRANCRRRQA